MKKRNIVIVFSLVAGLCFVLGDLSAVYAQKSDAEEFTLEEITVTAQKREEEAQKVPIAMEVISGDQLKELGKNDVEEILKSLGNAIISRAGDGLRVTLRGIADDADLFNDQHIGGATVAINIDGAYNNRSDAGQGLYDIERVEVLFGPQSTMYASSTPAGIVNIVTAAPKTDKYEVTGSLEYGNYNYLHTEGAMNAPLGDNAALRASFSTSVRDGYISNGADDDNSKSARLKFLVEPHDRLSVTLTGTISRNASRGFASVVAFDKESDVDDPWTVTEEAAANTPGDMKYKGITANIDLDLGIGVLTVIPAYSRNTNSGTRTSVFGENVSVDTFTSSNKQKNIEARMTSPSDFLFEYIIGGNYFNSEDRRSSYSDASASANVNDQEKKAVFLNITYPITEAFRVTGGYRKSWDETHNVNEVLYGQSTGPEFDTLAEYPGEGDYKLGVEYDLGQNYMIFADHSTSYRLQGAVMPRGDGGLYEPEKLKSYTVGSKNRFFGNKLQLNVSAYYYDYKNKFANQMIVAYGITEEMAQVDFDGDGDIDDAYVDAIGRDGGPNPDASGEIHDPNAQGYGDLEKYGLDIQANWLITGKDRLDLSVAYLHSQWATLYFDYYYDYVFPPDDYSGERDTFSPTITVNLSYSHNFNMQNGGVITPRFDVRYQSEYFLSWNPVDDPYRYQEAHAMIDLSGAYAHSDGKWTFSSYVKNLQNYAEKKSYFSMGMAGGGSMMIGEPRTYGAVLSVRF